MPELPEVETVCRGLTPVMEGARINRVEQRRPDLRFPFPEGFERRLTGAVVRAIRRRAKYVLVELDTGDVLVMHLGMSGRFTICATDAARAAPGLFVHDHGGIAAHDHVVFEMSNGCRITYNDPRRFGYMDVVPFTGLEQHKLFAGLGVEPLGNAFNGAHLAQWARGRTQDIKAFLLDQRVVAGLGNIYVCEALFEAGISPRRMAKCLATATGAPTHRAERLVPAIRDVLAAAIGAGGSTLRDYAGADGALGYFQHAFQVYGREGAPCHTDGCTSVIKRLVQGGRSTFHCSHCQR